MRCPSISGFSVERIFLFSIKVSRLVESGSVGIKVPSSTCRTNIVYSVIVFPPFKSLKSSDLMLSFKAAGWCI